ELVPPETARTHPCSRHVSLPAPNQTSNRKEQCAVTIDILLPISSLVTVGSRLLQLRDPVLYFVPRLRDEAHRFVYGTNRAKRSKAPGANPPDGIGPTCKRALPTHFGSAQAVSRAGIGDLKTVEGISSYMAQKINNFFRDHRW
ncbi:MAG: helix-hairpin-helix domain-containing protein, partial [Hyphomicrobium sp.]